MRKCCLVFLLALWLGGCRQNSAPEIETPPAAEPATATTPAQFPDRKSLKLIKIKNSVAPFFKPMGKPKPSDWLASFKESGQTFEEYLSGNPTLPTAARRTIYIQPAGEFSETQRKIIRLTADYMRAFYGLPVKINAEMSLAGVPAEMQRKNPSEGQRQIKTQYFIGDVLPKMLPPDAAALICFTSDDLWPGDDWNYVFGQASLQNRSGVWSLWRFGNPDKNEKSYKLFLARTLKIAMHETGHMFSIRHCTKYECLMSGANHLGETDRRPLDFCPECMAKISWAMNYEPAERYRNLAEFWAKQGWNEEKENFLKKLEAINKASKNLTSNQPETVKPLPELRKPSLVVKKKDRSLALFDDGKFVRKYKIALGFAPSGDKSIEGDGKTPEGEFYVFTKNDQSRFYLSLGLSYPNAAAARRGLKENLITRAEHDEIMQALAERRMPPQKTKLGGEIYIHGGGRDGDWTWGCVALPNEEIKELFQAIPLGTTVIIKS